MSNLQLGDKAPNFELVGVDDKTYRFSDYNDAQAVVVVFTCNHCPYALAWEGRFIQLQADFANRGVQFLAICANDGEKYPADSFPAMKDHASESGFNFPYLHDESQQVAKSFGAQRTPEVFVFDAEGTLRYHGAPDDNYDEPDAVSAHYLRDALEAVLAGNTPEVATTAPVGCTIKWKSE
jgi:peroxiredoxin